MELCWLKKNQTKVFVYRLLISHNLNRSFSAMWWNVKLILFNIIGLKWLNKLKYCSSHLQMMLVSELVFEINHFDVDFNTHYSFNFNLIIIHSFFIGQSCLGNVWLYLAFGISTHFKRKISRYKIEQHSLSTFASKFCEYFKWQLNNEVNESIYFTNKEQIVW